MMASEWALRSRLLKAMPQVLQNIGKERSPTRGGMPRVLRTRRSRGGRRASGRVCTPSRRTTTRWQGARSKRAGTRRRRHQLADAPGHVRESLEAYALKRLERLEQISASQEGVLKRVRNAGRSRDRVMGKAGGGGANDSRPR